MVTVANFHSMPGRVFIIHGTGGAPEGNWFPWLAAKLREHGTEVLVPRFPTPEGQNLQAWLRVFADIAGPLTPGDVLVGHSIGAAFALRLLERAETRIRAVFLIAGFSSQLGDPAFDPYTVTFMKAPFDWQKILRNSGSFFVYAGDIDPYVPRRFTTELAAGVGSSPVIIPGGGHLSAESGWLTLPFLWEEIRKSDRK